MPARAVDHAALPGPGPVPRAPLPSVLLVTFGSLAAPRHGTAVRGRATVEALAELGVPLYVVSTEEPDAGAGLTAIPGVLDARVARGRMHYGWSWELVRHCRDLSRRADVVLLGSAMLLPAAMVASPRLPIVWDANECETLHYSRMPRRGSSAVKGAIWYMVEQLAARLSAAVVTVSETEATYWRRVFPALRQKLHVVAHRPVATGGPSSPGDRPVGARRSVVFVGALSAKHNATAAQWLVGELAPRLPESVSLVLAGPGTEDVAGPTGRARIQGLGAVEDVDAVIRDAEVCVAPLSAGAGVKTKVLHYLSQRKRVVCTPVAAEGLEDAPGMETADLPHFAEAVLRLLDFDESPAARARREESQERWLEERHGGCLIASQWAAVLTGMPRSGPKLR